MELIDISVEYPSGMTITDRATLVTELRQVCVSERLGALLRELSVTEAPPLVTGVIGGRRTILDASTDGTFHASPDATTVDAGTFWSRAFDLVNSPTREQRQQFGRFLHTLSAASLIGAIGFWHSTTQWTPGNILSEVNLLLASVLTFYRGMVSMNGE